jgi:hypothetical protein
MKQGVFLVAFLFFVVSMPLLSTAGDVSINIGVALPPLEFAESPDVVVVPSGESYVYIVPDTPGIYFYDGYWYRTYGDRRYRSTIYRGPWTYISTYRIPRVIIDVRPDYYRHLPFGYHRIHSDDLQRRRRSWNRDRYWNRYDWYKHEVREHEKWRRSWPSSEHYRPGRDEHRRGGDIRGPQGDRNRPGGERYKPGSEKRKPRGDDRRRPVAPNQERGQDRERHEQRKLSMK